MDTVPPTAVFSPEFQLVLHCTRRGGLRRADDLLSLWLPRLDWQLFRNLALRHGVQSLVYTSLRHDHQHAVPRDILDALQADVTIGTARSMALLDYLQRLIRDLSREGIDVLPFKGPDLAL